MEKGEMSKEEHKQRHVELHKTLDELLADFLRHTNKFPSKTPIIDLMSWSHEQTIEPTEED